MNSHYRYCMRALSIRIIGAVLSLLSSQLSAVDFYLFDREAKANIDFIGQINEESAVWPNGELVKLDVGLDIEWSKKLSTRITLKLDEGELDLGTTYLRYRIDKGLRLTLGNMKVPFSAEKLVSRSELPYAERMLTGDSEFGSPGRQPGIMLDYRLDSISLNLFYGRAHTDSDNFTEVQFLNPLSDEESLDAQIDKGDIAALRLSWDHNRKRLNNANINGPVTGRLSLATYRWQNHASVGDLERFSGIELAAQLRWSRLMLEVQHNLFTGRMNDNRRARRLFSDTRGEFNQSSLRLRVMLINKRLDLVLARSQMQSVNWPQDHLRDDIGLNLYLDGHNNKGGIFYSIDKNDNGRLNEERRIYLQWVLSI